MKKWLYLLGAVAAIGLLARLPHPARDISELKPVWVVYLYMDGETLCIETDTGDSGSGKDLAEAASDLRSDADGEIFLETAEFLILSPEVAVTSLFYQYLRPGCRICQAENPPDLETAADYLTAHPPPMTLAHLRAESVM